MEWILFTAIGIAGIVMMVVSMEASAHLRDQVMRKLSSRQHVNDVEALIRYDQMRDQNFAG